MTSRQPRRGGAPSATAAGSGPISNALIRVTRLHVIQARQLFRAVGLHPGHELLLMHLWDTGPQRQADLAVVFDTDSAAMTRTVQRLERAGFVRRRPDPNDGRATLVETTAAGNGLRRSVEQLWAQLEAITTAQMTPARQKALLEGLEQVEHNLAVGHGSPEHEPLRSQDDGAGGD
ncbi:MarR family winged helix-turn-helix transcriptional regulator [Streptomyces sp. NPDC058467]|uniref:MarR family winged helix-turn-helix transcriptional regulator n=1 Tax=Streptomyces sp. NPDC058467 TaxID=3346513 RepID=UPI003650D0EB